MRTQRKSAEIDRFSFRLTFLSLLTYREPQNLVRAVDFLNLTSNNFGVTKTTYISLLFKHKLILSFPQLCWITKSDAGRQGCDDAGGLPLTSSTSVTNFYCVTEMFILLALLTCYVNKRSSYSIFFGQPHFVCLSILKNLKFQVPLLSTAKGEGYENITWKWIRAAPNFNALSPSTVGKFFWSWILKYCMEGQEKKQKVVVLRQARPSQNLKLGSLTSWRGGSVRFWKFTHAGEVVAPNNSRPNLRGSGGMPSQNFGS